MIIERSEALITLSIDELNYFTGKVATPAGLLSVKVRDRKGEFTHTYKSFRDRVEHVAEELHCETDRTVLIGDPDGETVATYNQRGLVAVDDLTSTT